jgi:hypothetical protein
MSPSQSLATSIAAANKPDASPVRIRSTQIWLASRNCRTYPRTPVELEYKTLRRWRSLVYSKIQSIAVESWYPTLRPGPSTYQSRELPSLMPPTLCDPSRPSPSVFNPCNGFGFAVVGSGVGDVDCCLDPDPPPDSIDRNLEPTVCFCLRLNDTTSAPSASRKSSESTAWSHECGTTGSSISGSSSTVGAFGGLRLDDEMS